MAKGAKGGAAAAAASEASKQPPPASWAELVEQTKAAQKHEVNLRGAALDALLEAGGSDAVPEEFGSLFGSQLTLCELAQSSRLRSLPDSLSALDQLHELLLVGNPLLAALPDSIGRLPLLRTVIAEGCGLTALPESLWRCPKLHTVNVSRNQLAALPANIQQAGELHYLNCSYNQLASLPGSLVRLPKLSTLIASHNAIAALPAGLSKLSQLADLQMTHNQLTAGLPAVPQELASAPKLKSLLLEANPFKDKKLPKVLAEGRLKNVLTHIKKAGTPPSAVETEQAQARAAEALAKLQLAAPYELLPVDKGSQLDVIVHPEVKGVRPHLACAVLRDVGFSEELYAAFIALQTQLHESLCNKREAAAIGTHDLSKLSLPLSYVALPPADVSFVPLARDKDAAAEVAGAPDAAPDAPRPAAFAPGQAVRADQLGAYFAGDKTMLRYLSYVADRPGKGAPPLLAVLRDARGAVLSLSPVINAEPCRVSQGSRDVLVEVSSPESAELAQEVAHAFLAGFGQALEAAGQGKLRVSPVRLVTAGTGHVRCIWPAAAKK